MKLIQIPDYWDSQSIWFIELDELEICADGKKRAASTGGESDSVGSGCSKKKD